MTTIKIFAIPAVAALSVLLSSVVVAQEKATPQEVVTKVREAARVLSMTKDVAQFNKRQGPWVWKGTYVFVQDCEKKVIVAYPLSAELIGQQFMLIQDTRGNPLFVKDYCDEARKPSGIWSEYWWPKPGEKEGSRKLTYSLGAKGTPYVVAAGIYDDKATISELSKLTSDN